MILDFSIPILNLKLTPAEIRMGKNLVYEINQNAKKTICLFTYATDDKCYSKEWWHEFYNLLLQKFSSYNIIEILPIENISNLSRLAPVFYSTNIRELASFMANVTVIIAADSGIMHLASSSLTTTIGLFSVTNPKIYAPYNSNSIAIDTNITQVHEISNIIGNILIGV